MEHEKKRSAKIPKPPKKPMIPPTRKELRELLAMERSRRKKARGDRKSNWGYRGYV